MSQSIRQRKKSKSIAQKAPATRARAKGPRWGVAHEQRGLTYAEHAVDFIQRYPIGQRLKSEVIDAWLERRGLLEVPRDVEKTSDAWIAHVRRRDRHLQKVRKSGRHPRMRNEFNLSTFNLVSIGFDEWEVQAPQTVVHERQFLQQIRSFIEAKRHGLDHLMQGVDFTELPSMEYALAEALYDDIDLLETMNSQHIESINIKFARIQERIERMISQGQAHLRLPE